MHNMLLQSACGQQKRLKIRTRHSLYFKKQITKLNPNVDVKFENKHNFSKDGR